MEEDSWEKAAAAALLIAANDDAFKVLETAREFYSHFNLTRFKVKGDGSCWVYAILAAMHLMESVHKTKEVIPSMRDRAMDETCRSFSILWLKNFCTHLTTTEMPIIKQLEDMPVYVDNQLIQMGSFGDSNTISGLAACLGISVVLWNNKLQKKRDVKQQVIVCLDRDECDSNKTWPYQVKEFALSVKEIAALCNESKHKERVAHIEWDGDGHYACMQSNHAVDSKMISSLMQSENLPDPAPKQSTPKPSPKQSAPKQPAPKHRHLPALKPAPKPLSKSIASTWETYVLPHRLLPRTKDIRSRKNMGGLKFQGQDFDKSHITEAPEQLQHDRYGLDRGRS